MSRQHSVLLGTNTFTCNSNSYLQQSLILVDDLAFLGLMHKPDETRGTGLNPVRSTRTICDSFSESKSCADSLLVCPTPVCIRMHKNVRTIKMLQSMSQFDGLWKHENNQHALVPLKTECGCPSGGGIKNGHIYATSSYGGTQKKRKKKDDTRLQ